MPTIQDNSKPAPKELESSVKRAIPTPANRSTASKHVPTSSSVHRASASQSNLLSTSSTPRGKPFSPYSTPRGASSSNNTPRNPIHTPRSARFRETPPTQVPSPPASQLPPLSIFQRYVLVPLMDALFWILVHIFYREVVVLGREHIPSTGPVVFYGNHNNQFIDALILRSTCRRRVRFIIAAKSLRRRLIAFFSTLMECVPVSRPQDVEPLEGAGRVVELRHGNMLVGKHTRFTQYSPGTTLWLPEVRRMRNSQPSEHYDAVYQEVSPPDEGGSAEGRSVTLSSTPKASLPTPSTPRTWTHPHEAPPVSVQIQSVVSDETVILHSPYPGLPPDLRIGLSPNGNGLPYRASVRPDHSAMYAEVYDTLGRGDAIGIFPEGGSHDRPSLLPLKSGVAVLSLGSAQRGVPPTLVPCGLTYFYGHRFRSVVHVEFGKPIRVTSQLSAAYAEDRKGTTEKLLRQLSTALRTVTLNAPDMDTLRFIHSLRRLYQPLRMTLPAEQYLKLFRHLSRLVENHPEHTALKQFRVDVEAYTSKCAALFVKDSQVPTLEGLKQKPTFRILLRRVLLLLVMGTLLLPFAVLGLPLGYVASTMAEHHAQQAKASSNLKLFGKDVKATYKLIIGFFLFPLVCVVPSLVAWRLHGMDTALTVLFCIPLVMYLSLFLVREWLMELQAAFPLFLSILSKHRQCTELYTTRPGLVKRAMEIVNSLDPTLSQEVWGFRTDRPSKEASLFSLRHIISRTDTSDDLTPPLSARDCA